MLLFCGLFFVGVAEDGELRTTSQTSSCFVGNATDRELLSVGGFTEKEGLNENLNFHHSKDSLCFTSQNLGLLGL